MSKLQTIFINIGVGAFTSLVTTVLVMSLFYGSGTSAPPPQPIGPAALLTGAQQNIQDAALPATPAPAGPEPIVQICKSDVHEFCAGQPTEADQEYCLQKHYDRVSSACHERLQKTRDNMAMCKEDIDKYCATMGYGGGKLAKCLQSHASELTSACAKRLGR